MEGRTDPQTGRFVVVIAGFLGAFAVVGYGIHQSQLREAATESMPAPQPPVAVPHSLHDLRASAAAARANLNVVALAEIEGKLREIMLTTNMATKAAAARVELADSLATRALEARIRAHVLQTDRATATSLADDLVSDTRKALADLPQPSIDPSRRRAIEARIELAAGQDIIASHPVVLLPTYREPDLRLAALSRELWITDGRDRELASEVIEAADAQRSSSALTRIIRVVALRRLGQAGAALMVVDELLATTPHQPLALGLKKELEGEPATVAAAAAPPSPTIKSASIVPTEPPPTPKPKAAPAAVDRVPVPKDPGPSKPVEPVTDPETKPSAPAKAPQTQANSARPPKRTQASVPAPSPRRPSPKRAKKPRGSYDELTKAGCKMVRTGKASAGFELLKKAHDLNPGAIRVTLCMAEAHHKLGRAESARALCDRVIRKSPKNVPARLLAARLEDERGNVTRALEHHRRVLAVDPDNPTALAYFKRHGKVP